MATIEQLIEIVGAPADSAAVQALVAADPMTVSTDPDMEEGEPLRGYLSAFEAGYVIMHCEGKIRTIFVYVLPADGFAPFQGSLPGELPSSATRTLVIQRFGIPSRNGEAMTYPILGRKGAWDRFDGDHVCVRFEYTEPDERVQMVTIMNTATAP